MLQIFGVFQEFSFLLIIVFSSSLIELEKQEDVGVTYFKEVVSFHSEYYLDDYYTNMVGCNWIELPHATWKLRSTSSFLRLLSQYQIEVDVAYDRLISHVPEEAWPKVASFRKLSFFIACNGRKGTFPETNYDPFIKIASGF